MFTPRRFAALRELLGVKLQRRAAWANLSSTARAAHSPPFPPSGGTLQRQRNQFNPTSRPNKSQPSPFCHPKIALRHNVPRPDTSPPLPSISPPIVDSRQSWSDFSHTYLPCYNCFGGEPWCRRGLEFLLSPSLLSLPPFFLSHSRSICPLMLHAQISVICRS